MSPPAPVVFLQLSIAGRPGRAWYTLDDSDAGLLCAVVPVYGQGTRVNTMAVENLNGMLLGLRERVDRAQVRL